MYHSGRGMSSPAGQKKRTGRVKAAPARHFGTAPVRPAGALTRRGKMVAHGGGRGAVDNFRTVNHAEKRPPAADFGPGGAAQRAANSAGLWVGARRPPGTGPGPFFPQRGKKRG